MTTPDSPRETLDLLLALISSATKDAVSEYEKTSGGVPSLDKAHPLDTLQISLALRQAVRVLEGACEQLCTILAPPAHTLASRAMASLEMSSLRVAVEARLPDMIRDHPNGLHVKFVSEKTGIDEGKLARIFRFLASRNCFREVTPDVFANNRLSLTLLESNTISSLVGFVTDESNKGSAWMYECLTDPKYAHSNSPLESPFCYGVRTRNKDWTGSVFDWYGANPREGRRVFYGMVGWTRACGAHVVAEVYPFKDLPAGTTVCDVGGGLGGVSIELARLHPHLSITLQDIPVVLEEGKQFWNKELPAAITENRISFEPLDFFTGTPIKNQDVYYMKHIVHDWPDDEALLALRNTRDAMGPKSILLIHEILLVTLADELKESMGAPKPLLYNYGTGSLRMFTQDVHMFSVLNGKERSIDDIKVLAKKAGLRLTRTFDLVETAVLEFMKD